MNQGVAVRQQQTMRNMKMTCANVADDRGLILGTSECDSSWNLWIIVEFRTPPNRKVPSPRDSLARSSHLQQERMTENTYQQIEILHRMNPQSVDFPRETVQNKENQRAQFTHVAPRITEEQASCRSKPLQGKERKDANCTQNTHVTLNWLKQLKK